MSHWLHSSTCLTFSSTFLNVFLNRLFERMQGRTGNICLIFSVGRFQMFLQMACLWGCLFTLFALVWLFSTVCFQMCPQIACIRGCINTPIAFVWLFSTVNFIMPFQIACLWKGIVTLVAFVRLHSLVNVLLKACHIFTDHQILLFRSWFHLQHVSFVVVCLLLS